MDNGNLANQIARLAAVVVKKKCLILDDSHYIYLFALCFVVAATPTAVPGQGDDDKALDDWMIAVIAGVAGVLVIVVLVLLIYCRTIRKKTDGGKEIPTKLFISVFKETVMIF